MLYTEVPVTKNGNMKSFACLKKQFSGKRLSRERISKVLAGKPVERFDLITLIFLIYALDDENLESGAGPRFSAFVEVTNELLMEADMMELYPVNPYEAFILMCVVSEDLIDTFALVWKKSYEE